MIYYGEVIFLIFLTHFYSPFYSFTFPITSLISLFFSSYVCHASVLVFFFPYLVTLLVLLFLYSFQIYFRYQKLLLFLFFLLHSFTNLTSFSKGFTCLCFHVSLFLLLTISFLLLAIGSGLVPPISFPMRGSSTRRRVYLA